MKIDVYDTYAKSKTGNIIHFDVLLPNGDGKEIAFKFAQDFLQSIGESVDSLRQDRCNFCHSENVSGEIENIIQKNGHFILQMEGCPKPFR